MEQTVYEYRLWVGYERSSASKNGGRRATLLGYMKTSPAFARHRGIGAPYRNSRVRSIVEQHHVGFAGWLFDQLGGQSGSKELDDTTLWLNRNAEQVDLLREAEGETLSANLERDYLPTSL